MKELAKVFDKMVDCMLEADEQLQELKAQKDAIVSEIGERRYNLLIQRYNRVLGVFEDAESVSLLLSEISKKRLFRSASKTRRRVPRDMFRRPSRNIMPRDLDKVRPKAIPPNAYDDIPFSGGQHDFYGALHELVADGLESDQIVRKLTRRFKVKAPFILEELRRFYGKQMRVASTRRVAGHIVLAGTVDVTLLRRVVEDTDGIDDVEIEDGVLTFFMDKFENKSVEKQIKAIAKKFRVNFQKGDFTNGLGMIETRTASRRNRRASKPLFELKIIRQEATFDESGDYDIEYEDVMEEDVYSFGDLLEELERVGRDFSWGEWSESRPEINGSGRSSWLTSYEEQDYRTGASINYTLHFNPSKGVRLDPRQIKMIEEALDKR